LVCIFLGWDADWQGGPWTQQDRAGTVCSTSDGDYLHSVTFVGYVGYSPAVYVSAYKGTVLYLPCLKKETAKFGNLSDAL
jgi:hypothetical protein